jgi:hypothetical protein
MRLLYLYPEEWTGRRAREVHTLSTCIAMAQAGVNVTLVTAGGKEELRRHLLDVAGVAEVPGLQLVPLSRSMLLMRSAKIFAVHFRTWLLRQEPFNWAYIIHLKAGAMLQKADLPYAFEAHEIFAETPQGDPARDAALHQLEQETLTNARARIATSAALAQALRHRYTTLPDDFCIAPNAGIKALDRGIGAADGPFVYCGSIADWKGLDVVIHAAREAAAPLKIVGGSEEEWKTLAQKIDTRGIAWLPRVPLAELPHALTGSRAGLIPTQPETPSGRYSCPMKLFDYARCGLPVITTALPSLQSLDVGSWCHPVAEPTVPAWTEALRHFHYNAGQSEAPRVWANHHTWKLRAQQLVRRLAEYDVRANA